MKLYSYERSAGKHDADRAVMKARRSENIFHAYSAVFQQANLREDLEDHHLLFQWLRKLQLMLFSLGLEKTP